MSKANSTLVRLCLASLIGSASFFGVTDNVYAADSSSAKTILAKPKLSDSLSDIAQPLPELTKARKNKLRRSGEKVPGEDLVKEVPNRNHPFAKDVIRNNQANGKDTVLQKGFKSSPFSKLVPSITTGFDGMGNVQGAVPPDTNADVGPNHVVQMVNTALAIWDKDGNQLVGPIAINNLWDGFGGLCESTNRGDPIVLYDSAADRWMLSQFAFNDSFTDNHQCIAVSQTGDPTGAYYLYDFFWSDTKFNDYPHYGVWNDGYYAGVNQFTGNSFTGAGVVAYEREKMLAGQPAQQVIFDLENTHPGVFTPMPADIDGIHLPPVGMPEYFVTAGTSANTMDVWTFDVDWGNTANSSFELKNTLTVANYDGGVCSFSRDCIVQPNSQKLDAIGQRMMFRLAYRFLEGAEHKLVANHTVVGSDTDNNIAGVRWYEFDIDGATGDASVANQGTFNVDDGNSRWMGSAAMDAAGNIGVAYSVSGPSTNPSIRFSGRKQGDPADTLTVVEGELKAGGGSQLGANRWGDYSSLSVDPVDDCTFWYTTEYYKAGNNSTTSWSTYIGSFKFDNCVAGPSGTIDGTVTDVTSGDPIAGVQVTTGAATVITDSEGNYSLTLPVGTGYDLAFSKYGWLSNQVNDVDLAEDEAKDIDISLSEAAPVIVTGTVLDGSGLNVPLYAQVSINAPGVTLTTYTNPETGAYSLEAFEGTLVQIKAAAIDPGYLEQSFDITPDVTPVQNFSLTVDGNCVAEGYGFNFPAFYEGFDSGVPPTGWTVEDVSSSGFVWQTASTLARGNLLNVDGEAAAIDSDAAGPSPNVNTRLVSPVINVADIDTTTLSFASLFRTFGGSDIYEVELSVDGGAWNSIHTPAATNTVELVSVDLSAQLTGATSFQIRFAYNATYEYYAFVDNVAFGSANCVSTAGTYTMGYVVDGNTSEPIVGAKLETASSLTVTVDTSDDENLDDGFYRLFVPQGEEQDVVVSANRYQSNTVDIFDFDKDSPIVLEAGLLQIDDTSIDITAGREGSIDYPLDNLGKADANFNVFISISREDEVLKPFGPFDPSTRHFGPKALLELNTKKIRYASAFNAAILPVTSVDFVDSFETTLTYGWGVGLNRDTETVWVGDLTAGGAALDALHSYSKAGDKSGDFIDTSSIATGFAADLAYNARTGTLWQVSTTGDFCIHEVDTAAQSVTGNKICPDFGVSQRGLAYDPLSGTYYAGSWNDSIIHQFTEDGTILRSINVELSVSGLAFNPLTNHLFVLSNDIAGSTDPDIIVLDTTTSDLQAVSQINFPVVDVDGDDVAEDSMDGGQAGLAMDCDGTLWAVNQDTQRVVGITSGEKNVCDFTPTWLTLTSLASGTVSAGGSQSIQLDVDTLGLDEGDYRAQLVVANDTPYGSITSNVTLTVNEASNGTITLADMVKSVSNGSSVELIVSRVDGSDFEVSVDYSTADGSAVAEANYTATSGTLTWADGETDDKVITIDTTDTDLESDIDFVINLSNAQEAALGNTQATVVIRQDEESDEDDDSDDDNSDDDDSDEDDSDEDNDGGSGGGGFGFIILMLLAVTVITRRRNVIS